MARDTVTKARREQRMNNLFITLLLFPDHAVLIDGRQDMKERLGSPYFSSSSLGYTAVGAEGLRGAECRGFKTAPSPPFKGGVAAP
jgi:hypothetical protein